MPLYSATICGIAVIATLRPLYGATAVDRPIATIIRVMLVHEKLSWKKS